MRSQSGAPPRIWLTPARGIAIAAVSKPTNRIELIGVLYFGCKYANHGGSKRSQPATIGRRELPVRCTLVEETERIVIRIMPKEAIAPAIGNERSPRRKVCGTGPIRSMGLSPINASTE